jgi:hypothetical protein
MVCYLRNQSRSCSAEVNNPSCRMRKHVDELSSNLFSNLPQSEVARDGSQLLTRPSLFRKRTQARRVSLSHVLGITRQGCNHGACLVKHEQKVYLDNCCTDVTSACCFEQFVRSAIEVSSRIRAIAVPYPRRETSPQILLLLRFSVKPRPQG